MKILGLISGTSHDGIDHAVVDFDVDGDALVATVVSHGTTPYGQELRARLVAALPPADTTLAEIAKLDTLIGQAFADAASAVIGPCSDIDLIVSHGQTVYHWVDGTNVLGTLQIGQPAWIAERTGKPILADIRIRDITVGGQGAPLASTLDRLVLAQRPGPVAALNLGGISNVTVVGDGAARAWDIGPANALIDAIVVERGLNPSGYDADGTIASVGTIDEELLAALLREPYYSSAPPKSTGKELFHLAYIHELLENTGCRPGDADLIATLTELTIRTVADALRPEDVRELFVSGGGTHNRVIMDGLAAALPDTAVLTTDALGLGADEKEAVLMALLGWLAWHGIPSNVPTATGAREPRVLGALTPGSQPLRLPEPRSEPRFLRMSGAR